MPGNVGAAVPISVLPWSLATAFSRSNEWPIILNEYRNGECQRQILVETSRKSWAQTRRLSATQVVALRSFLDSRSGPWEAFYFYDVWETNPKFSYDASGVAETGRYVVRLEGEFSHEALLHNKHAASLALVQVA